MTDEELAHFGVKGMKWGVRTVEPGNQAYTKRMQTNDKNQHGQRAVERINRRLNEGLTRKEALHKEDVRNAKQRFAVVGGIFAARLLTEYGSTSVPDLKSYVGGRAEANRTAAHVVENTLSIGAKASKINYTKARRGVHTITTMK